MTVKMHEFPPVSYCFIGIMLGEAYCAHDPANNRVFPILYWISLISRIR